MDLFTSFFDSEYKLVYIPTYFFAHQFRFINYGKKVRSLPSINRFYENKGTITNICFILNLYDIWQHGPKFLK